MPSEMSWYIPDHILYVTEYGDLTLEEVKATNETARRHLNASPRELHVVIDHTRLDSAPKSLAGLLNTLDTFRHRNMGWFVIFGHAGNRYFRALAQFITLAFGTQMREVDTREQALVFLMERDASLIPLIEATEGQKFLQDHSQG